MSKVTCCQHAASGCNYPEGECLGLCAAPRWIPWAGGGRPLSPLEQGLGSLRLINMRQAVAEIAQRGGWHRPPVENGLALADAPVAVQKLVAEGKVASHTALKAVRQHGATAGTEKLVEGVKVAEAAGKKKATAKHLNEPKERGQTLPPAAPAESGVSVVRAKALINRIADLSPLVNLRYEIVAELVKEARAILGDPRS